MCSLAASVGKRATEFQQVKKAPERVSKNRTVTIGGMHNGIMKYDLSIATLWQLMSTFIYIWLVSLDEGNRLNYLKKVAL